MFTMHSLNLVLLSDIRTCTIKNNSKYSIANIFAVFHHRKKKCNSVLAILCISCKFQQNQLIKVVVGESCGILLVRSGSQSFPRVVGWWGGGVPRCGPWTIMSKRWLNHSCSAPTPSRLEIYANYILWKQEQSKWKCSFCNLRSCITNFGTLFRKFPNLVQYTVRHCVRVKL